MCVLGGRSLIQNYVKITASKRETRKPFWKASLNCRWINNTPLEYYKSQIPTFFANVDDTLLGINTYRSYHAVLDAIKQQGLSIDLIVATGDLVQDQSFAAYQHFC